jgi:hypothetical protein
VSATLRRKTAGRYQKPAIRARYVNSEAGQKIKAVLQEEEAKANEAEAMRAGIRMEATNHNRAGDGPGH